MITEEQQVIDTLENEGYFRVKLIEGRGFCGIRTFIYTWGLCYGIDKTGCAGRYCYEHILAAVEALSLWNGKGDPSGKWVKHKAPGIDIPNPNYITHGCNQ